MRERKYAEEVEADKLTFSLSLGPSIGSNKPDAIAVDGCWTAGDGDKFSAASPSHIRLRTVLASCYLNYLNLIIHLVHASSIAAAATD